MIKWNWCGHGFRTVKKKKKEKEKRKREKERYTRVEWGHVKAITSRWLHRRVHRGASPRLSPENHVSQKCPFVLGKLEHSPGRYIIIDITSCSLLTLSRFRFPWRNHHRSARSQETKSELVSYLNLRIPRMFFSFLRVNFIKQCTSTF